MTPGFTFAALLAAAAPGDAGFGDFSEPELPTLASNVDARGAGGISPPDNLTVRGVCLKLGGGTSACFDTDLLRLAIAWRGGFLSDKGIAPVSYQNPHTKAPEGTGDLPKPTGDPVFANGIYPGCVAAGAPISDPRTPAPDPKEVGRGPLPPEMGRFEGLYVHGSRATLAYSLFGGDVREQLESVPGGVARTIRFTRVAKPCRLVMAQVPPAAHVLSKRGDRVVVDLNGSRLVVTATFAPAGASLEVEGGRHVTFALPRRQAPATFRVALQRLGPGEPLPALIPAAIRRPPRLEPFDRGGPRRWQQSVFTTGRVGRERDGFAVDDLTLPEPNPWRRRVRLSGIAFFPDGRAAVSTIDGDIWIVSGIDERLARIEWRRFASGLHEPQSVVVRKGEIFTFTRSGIVRLADLDRNGEADHYANFCDLPAQTGETREFPMDMVLRPDGGFTVAKGGQQRTRGKHNASIIAVASDGRSIDVIATGLRQPYLGIHPKTGLLTASDQQGHFIPSTPVHVVRKGAFYGFREPHHPGPFPSVTEPVVWIPHHVVQSGAGQVWVTGGKMGPLAGHLLYLDYNSGAMARVFLDEDQGAVFRLPLAFPGALLKAAMNPGDDWLYAVGFQLWGSGTQRLSGFFRVRASGAASPWPADVRSDAKGILLRFPEPLDPAAAAVPGRYVVKRWNYKRAPTYGSGFYRLDGNPGQEDLWVWAARLSQDRRSVFLLVDDMKPAMQVHVSYRLRSAAGRDFADEVYLTVARLKTREPLRAEFQGLDAPAPPSERLARPAGAGILGGRVPVTIESGKDIALRLGCASCHSTDGTILGRNGSTWKGLFGSRRRFADGSETLADETYLRESIYEPGRRVIQEFAGKDVGMPSYVGIIEEDHVKALILYIRSLK